MPDMVNTPEMRFQVDESRKFPVIEEVLDRLVASGAEVKRTDGARVNTVDGWLLLRASNAHDVMHARAEAQTTHALEPPVAQITIKLYIVGCDSGSLPRHYRSLTLPTTLRRDS